MITKSTYWTNSCMYNSEPANWSENKIFCFKVHNRTFLNQSFCDYNSTRDFRTLFDLKKTNRFSNFSTSHSNHNQFKLQLQEFECTVNTILEIKTSINILYFKKKLFYQSNRDSVRLYLWQHLGVQYQNWTQWSNQVALTHGPAG